MKSQKLLDAKEQIDDKYVVEQIATRKTQLFAKLALAACFLLACILGGTAMLNTQTTPSISAAPTPEPFVPDENLAIINIDGTSRFSGGMGFEGFLAKNFKEIINNNPWNKDTPLQYLPVYRNARYNEETDKYNKPNIDKMSAQVLEVSKRLGINETQLTITEDYQDEETIKGAEERYAK